MRVLAGPRADPARDRVVAAAAAALAGPDGSVVSLTAVGIHDLARRTSQAEVALLRRALRGGGTGAAVVGYVCGGAAVAGGQAAPVVGDDPGVPLEGTVRLVAVTDHADLTWRSPLTGPNDPGTGPRFPSMTGIYSPETALDRLGAAEGMIVVSGVVAGIRDDSRPTAYEVEMAVAQCHVAMSSELVPVVIVAAHLGMRVAAVLVVGSRDAKEW